MNETRTTWEPFDQPIRASVSDAAPPWRDNAWFCFWDLHHELFGEFHVSTSPNSAGSRARCSVLFEGTTAELVETPGPGSFVGDAIDFSAVDRLEAHSDQLTLDIQVAPRFALADFSQRSTIPPLVPGEPLQHYQRAATVTGKVVVGGRSVVIDGVGFRDRTWGYRDSANWAEYVGLNAVFPTFAITSILFKSTDGTSTGEGYVLGDGAGSTEVTGMTVTRDARGLFAATSLTPEGGGQIDLRAGAGSRGFWIPQGAEKTGPTMSSYGEFFPISTGDGEEGLGRFEQGILRTIY
jgi:hypothetical protein